MKPCRVLMFAGFWLALSAFAWGQTKAEFPITDRSDITGVLQISGTVTSVEQFVGNQLRASCGIKAHAKNISGKPVLLAVTSLDTSAPLGGCNTHHIYQMEFFFSKEAAPDVEIALEDSNPNNGGMSSGPYNPLQQTDEPKANARLVFVEFADGSSVGDDSAARAILQNRGLLLERLRSLFDAYSSGGEDALTRAMDYKDENSEVQWQITGLRDLKNSRGTEAAVARLKFMLQSADSHKAARTLP